MVSRNRRPLTDIPSGDGSSQQYATLGEEPSKASSAPVDELSEEELKSAMSDRGYELHQKRKQRGAMTQKEEVPGKKRVTIYIPTGIRTAVGYASVATEKNISTIVSESLELWMAKNGFRY